MAEYVIYKYVFTKTDEINLFKQTEEGERIVLSAQEHLQSHLTGTSLLGLNKHEKDGTLTPLANKIVAQHEDVTLLQLCNKTKVAVWQDFKKEYFDSEESVIPSAPVENQPCTSKIALRNGKTKDTGRGNKVKFMRVIMALYKANYFELPGGGDVGVETVFKAFGDMVGEDYSDYAEHLYSAGNHNINNPDKTLQVFEELKRGFKKYLDEKPEE